jgi:hypothetical protein
MTKIKITQSRDYFCVCGGNANTGVEKYKFQQHLNISTSTELIEATVERY